MNRAVCLLALLPAMVAAEPLRQHDRDFAMSHLHATRKQILDLTAGLSPAQMNYRATPESWSIAQCLEHATATGRAILAMVTGEILKSVARPSRGSGNDDSRYLALLAKLTNRETKVQAPKELVPPAAPADPARLLADFRVQTGDLIAFVRSTPLDLHAHFKTHPTLGELDAYEWILFASGHTERHYLQMKEVMSAKGFPAR